MNVSAAAAPTSDGDDPRAQRPGARAGDPDVHGRFGNLEKSGGRFST